MPDMTRDESMDELLDQIEGGEGKGEGNRPSAGSRIHRLREERHVTLRTLAGKTGFSEAFLSQVENHMAAPPLGVLVRVANALDTTVASLLGEEEGRDFTIVRRGENPAVERDGAAAAGRTSYAYESLGSGKANRTMEPFIVHLPPGTDPHAPGSVHEGEEFLFVLEGEVEIVLDRHADQLHPGDSAYYSSGIPHRVRSAGIGPAKVLAVLTQGRRDG